MPSTADPRDRKILTVAGTILLLLIVATVAFAPQTNDAEGQGVPSTYSTANNGAEAAYLLLRELGYRSERWEKPPTELPLNSGRANSDPRRTFRFPGQKRTRSVAAFREIGRLDYLRGKFPVSLS